MANREPITSRTGQARRAVWTVTKYAVLTVAGILLFRAGAAYALQERGYAAVGGEGLVLFLPVFYYIISQAVRDIIADIKSGYKPQFMEENEI